MSAHIEKAWEQSLPGSLTSVVAANGRLYVAQKNAYTLLALDTSNGAVLWRFTAGARIDSPPTIHGSGAYFGCADGWIYCLRAADGVLVWRFRAAPNNRQIGAFGRIESAWPVHGSVLAHDGRIYAAAGRSSYLDGGIYLYCLDARTGAQVAKHCIDHRDSETNLEKQKTITGKRGTYMPGALPDILSCDGKSIFMRHARFDLQCRPVQGEADHLFSPAGFLDGSWWHRTYWLIGSKMLPDYHGWPVMGRVRITGRLLAPRGDRVFGFGRTGYEKAGSHLGLNTEYHLFCAKAELGPPVPPKKNPGNWWTSFPGSRVQHIWKKQLPFYVRAMVPAGETLFITGPENITNFNYVKPKDDIALWAVSTKDGSKIAEYKLPAPPVFDGMAAAQGRLYVPTVDGRVICFRAR
jgi:outer membrane protein assembly factor BamB